MAAARRRRLSARIAGLLLAVLVVLPVAAAPSTAAPEAPDATGTRLTITSMTPVADGDGRATVRGRLTNTGTETLESPSVRLVPQQAGSRRSDIATWTEGTRPVEGVSLDDDSLDDLPAGRSTPFVLRVDADDLLPDGRPIVEPRALSPGPGQGVTRTAVSEPSVTMKGGISSRWMTAPIARPKSVVISSSRTNTA